RAPPHRTSCVDLRRAAARAAVPSGAIRSSSKRSYLSILHSERPCSRMARAYAAPITRESAEKRAARPGNAGGPKGKLAAGAAFQMSAERNRPVRILLGVTGGIAAYKSPELVRRLIERGCEVQVVL